MAVKSNTTSNHDIRCRTNVARLNVSSLSPRCLQTRIRPSRCCKQKQDSSANTMSFHSIVHIRCSSYHWQLKRLWFPVKGKRSKFRTFHFAANGVKWYERTPNDA
ncbi:hypothetical protein TNCV_4473451 [Trichonephila clavipes]|nr:hypothetical protein TNCV_4473451 [Trichonephila clavipes]